MIKIRPLDENFSYEQQKTKDVQAKFKKNSILYYEILEQSVKSKAVASGVSIPEFLNLTSYFDIPIPDLILNQLNSTSRLFIAYDNNVAVGAIGWDFYWEDGDVGLISNIAVIPNMRNKGIERILLKFAEYEIEKKAIRNIEFEQSLKESLRNRRFYPKIMSGNAHPTVGIIIHKGDSETIDFFETMGYSKEEYKENYVYMTRKVSMVKKDDNYYLDESLPGDVKQYAYSEPPVINNSHLGDNDYVRLDPDKDEDINFWQHLGYINDVVGLGRISSVDLLDMNSLRRICDEHRRYVGSMIEWVEANEKLYYLGIKNGFRIWSRYQNKDLILHFDSKHLGQRYEDGTVNN